jgi:hypothetical protein
VEGAPVNILNSLTTYGPLGVICVAFAYAIIWLAKQNSTIQEARINDAKAWGTSAMAQRDEVVRAMMLAAAGMTQTREAIEKLNEQTEKLTDRLPPRTR